MLPESKTKIHNPKTRAMLLAAIYIAQEQYGWLSPEAVQRVADRLHLTPGQVFSTASFYTMFRMRPEGQFRIQICEGLSCYLVGGAEPVSEYLMSRLQIGPGESTPDGRFSLEVVECLAACDFAPAIKINDELYGNITQERIDEILAELSAKP
jgi:NADH-quinone oxidoreductase E subunit